ncbi:MAG: acetylglutamate kinase [Treponemataceae bacterium]|nr:acetylglutamate kinase [Treponemataceae bacterium]
MISNSDWTDVLVQALPYIQRYWGKTFVVKYGGNAMLNQDLKQAVMEDLVLMNLVGIRTVLVHGGGPEINAGLAKIGKEPKFVNGLRYTDEETMEVVQQVLAGKLNKEIVALLQKAGGKAVGLCGIDGGMLEAVKMTNNGTDLGFVGEVTNIDVSIVENLMKDGFIPVISTVAGGAGDDVHSYNINADTAAAKIAVALKAEKFVQMTNVPGLLRDVNDPTSLISVLKREDIPQLVESGVISSGMIPKVECCTEALEGGVLRTHIIDGRVPHALLLEVFSDRGAGTMIL